MKSKISYLFTFAVFKVEIKIFLISRQSSISDCPSLSVIYSDKTSNLSQYSVSAVSLRDICNFAIKCALLIP